MSEAAGETKEYPSVPRPIAGWVCSPMSHIEVQAASASTFRSRTQDANTETLYKGSFVSSTTAQVM
jgi:hypothetical protein